MDNLVVLAALKHGDVLALDAVVMSALRSILWTLNWILASLWFSVV